MIEIIRRKEISLARHSGYRFAHWLLAACLLTSSTLIATADAAVTVLAGGQTNAGNIIVDGSRVYWINQNTSAVRSIDKLSSGTSSVTTHYAGTGFPGGNIVQDNASLYFTANGNFGRDPATNLTITEGVFKVGKSSTLAVRLAGAGDDGLAISTGMLYYVSSSQIVPNSGGKLNGTIQKISTSGGTPINVVPLVVSPAWPDTGSLSVDNTYVHWGNVFGNTIQRAPLVGGAISTDVATAPNPGAIFTPTPTGAAGSYLFWGEGTASAPVLKRKHPLGGIITLFSGSPNFNIHNFVVVGASVYTTTLTGTIVKVPIDGLPVGVAAPVVISAADAKAPVGLASDGVYLYWTAAGDGTIRRAPIMNNRTDFNLDGNSDALMSNTAGAIKIGYMKGATLLSTVNGPTIPAGWTLASVNDVNGDGKPDFVLRNTSTSATAFWYLNNATYVSGVSGPTLPSGWTLRATADFNRDGKPDYLLFNPTTLQTFIWYMNGASYVSGIGGPTLPSGWTLVCANDLNGDGKPDYLLVDAYGNTKIWIITTLNGTSSTFTSVIGPVIPAGWKLLSALGDYNRDNKPDWVIFNPSTLQTQIWYMNGSAKLSSAAGPALPSGFSVFGR